MTRSLRIGLVAALALLLATPAFAGEKAAPPKNDWSGWWFVYYRDANGNLALDKFTKAMVVNDAAASGTEPITGQWVGCMWMPNTRVRYGKDRVSLTFSPLGAKNYTFKMTRTGPDEAEGVYLDTPTVKYVVKRQKDHGECAGYELSGPEPK